MFLHMANSENNFKILDTTQNLHYLKVTNYSKSCSFPLNVDNTSETALLTRSAYLE
jgi:hypothetical protein